MNQTEATWLVTLVATMVIWNVQAWCEPELEAAAMPALVPDEPELFLDDHFVTVRENVKTELQQPEKCPANPVVKPDKFWEGVGAPPTRRLPRTTHPSVVVDPQTGKFRMYYATFYGGSRVCYAESDDGVHWIKPELDLHPFRDKKRTNIILPDANSFWVIPNPDPKAPDDQRYLGFLGLERKKLMAARKETGKKIPAKSTGYASSDGIHWRQIMDTHHAKDTFPSVVWCPADKRFRAYTRNWREHGDYGKTRFDTEEPQFRQVDMMESPDFLTWTAPRFLFETDARDGAPLVQCYGLGVTRYGNGFVGTLSVLYIDESVEGWHRGHQNTQLMFSRDGVRWNRVADRAVFIEHGPEGAFDWGEAYYSGGIFAHGDKTYCYYTGKATLHKGPGDYAIGLATLPRDRLIALSQEDSSRPAIVETKVFKCRGNRLLVNSTGQGNLQVEVLDADAKPLPGYSFALSSMKSNCLASLDADAKPLPGYSAAAPIYQSVIWKTDDKARTLADLGEKLQAGIRLRFRLKGVRLHAFKVAE